MKNQSSKSTYVLIMLILINIVGCQNNSNQAKEQGRYATIKSAKKIKYDRAIPASNGDTVIVSQEFSYDALAFDVFKADTDKIKSLFLDPVTLKMEKATTEEGEPYYLHKFTDGINKIILFRNDNSFYIKDAEIKNNKILLNKKISIGMKKDAFQELFKVKDIKCDSIIVTDEESTFASVYIFKDAKLREIKMGSILE